MIRVLSVFFLISLGACGVYGPPLPPEREIIPEDRVGDPSATPEPTPVAETASKSTSQANGKKKTSTKKTK